MENVPVTNNSVAVAPAPTMPLPTTPLGQMQSNVSRQPIMKQVGFLLAIAASIALGGYVLMWSQTPNYQVLFSGMQPKESSEVVAILQQSNIDYKLDPSSGVLLVPSSELQGLRLKLAAEGLPRSASPGMEMLDQDQGFGTSQFVERARYQRAMEEELSRSISEIHNVRSARVHLAVPKQSVFVRERKPPSASVVVNLYAGRNLERGQVAAITHMVASSVPNMSNEHITVVDQKGNLLTQPERDKGLALSDSQMQYTQKLEKRYIQRIEDILSPIVGMEGVRAQVVADVDFTVTEQTHESFNPDIAAVRSEQVQEESRVGAVGPIGVPGALSNQPPIDGMAPEVATGLEGELTVAKPGSSSKQSTRNFELDRTISHTRLAPGAIRKLSVAVLVDERRSIDARGNVESRPLTEQEMTRINALIMDAIGFNKARGDSLNVVNAAFIVPPSVEELPEVPLWEQPWLWDVVKQVMGGLLVLFLVFGVIRPAFKDLNKVPVDPNKAGALTAEQIFAMQNANELQRITTGSEGLEDQLETVRNLVKTDPALVAQVVKNWTKGGDS
ncbi:MAG: flagellar basal-body MS-ring/collar protein FliF [Gammaproteobacteria bacterium]|nr:flagellar basal-body MS-ring/collar protein FliF [Gammaproteobacteria bacterium]